MFSSCLYQCQIQSDLGDLRNERIAMGFARGSLCLEKVLATDSSDLPAAHIYPPSTVIKKSYEKAQNESRDLNSEDIEEVAKQTLLSTEDVEMWVTHHDSVRKRRQASARKAAATRKQKSARQKSSEKVDTAGNEFWCLCGRTESGNMIAGDNPGRPYRVVPF